MQENCFGPCDDDAFVIEGARRSSLTIPRKAIPYNSLTCFCAGDRFVPRDDEFVITLDSTLNIEETLKYNY